MRSAICRAAASNAMRLGLLWSEAHFRQLRGAPEPDDAGVVAPIHPPHQCISSKKVENHAHAVALHFMHYNFSRIHNTLRVTPAMAAGVATHVWSPEEIVGLLAGCG
jgi:hypothetical protein